MSSHRSTPIASPGSGGQSPSSQPKSLQPKELGFIGVFSLLILALTTLPYLFASVSASPERQFMGFILNTSDHTQYLAWYKAFQTAPLIPNLQTSEPNPAIFFNLLWWSLGRLGLYTGLSYAVIYQLFRWAAGAFFFLMVYLFAAQVFSDIFRRRVAFLVTTLGAGLGWVLVVMKYSIAQGELLYPLGVYLAEGNSFLCVLAYPHFAEAAGLILAIFTLLLIGERKGQLRYALYAGLTALFLGWQHAYDLLIIWLIPSAYGAALFLHARRWPWYWFKAMLIVGLLSWPPALYSVLLTRLNPIWEAVLAQFDNAGVFTPSPLLMVIPMGLLLILACLSLGVWLRRWSTRRFSIDAPDDQRYFFLGVWFLVGWALTYLPTDFQIHMINSWQAPLGMLTTLGFFDFFLPWITNSLSRRPSQAKLSVSLRQRPWLPALGLLLVLIPTNLYLFAWRFTELKRSDYPYFLYRDEVQVMEWLEQNAPEEAIVFSSYEIGKYIPGLSGRRAFLSHWAQTVDFFHKRALVDQFFTASPADDLRLEMIETYAIDYVIAGPAEQMLGPYDPEQADFLSLVFATPRVNLYAVIR